MQPNSVVSLITSLLEVPLPDLAANDAEKRIPKPDPLENAPPWRLRAATELADDPALPALREIRAACLAGAFPPLGPGGRPVELLVHSYKPGKRVALEVRAGHRRLAVKAYASNPVLEAELYEALAEAGLAGDSAVRVPPLLAWSPERQVVVIGWLEGPTAQELVERGQGERAGELAACWLQRAATLPVALGPRFGRASVRSEARHWAVKLGVADRILGIAATALVEMLARIEPHERTPRLVHGSLYARHVLDLGDGVGLIVWDCFGQGPPELDAGMFLATLWRLGLLHEDRAAVVARAERKFLAATAGHLNEDALAWHRAAALLHLAERGCKPTTRRKGEWQSRAHALLGEAMRLLDSFVETSTFLYECFGMCVEP